MERGRWPCPVIAPRHAYPTAGHRKRRSIRHKPADGSSRLAVPVRTSSPGTLFRWIAASPSLPPDPTVSLHALGAWVLPPPRSCQGQVRSLRGLVPVLTVLPSALFHARVSSNEVRQGCAPLSPPPGRNDAGAPSLVQVRAAPASTL